MSLSVGFPGALSGALRLSQESAEHAARFLGLPLWIWQILNLVLFFAVLLYFVARPMAEAFRRRQLEVEERRRQAETQRAQVQALAAEIRERTARLEREIEEVRREGVVEGHRVQAALTERAEEEGARIRRDAQEEIERRLSAAKSELRRTAADLTASAATELVSGAMTEDDRRRLLSESVERMKQTR